MKSEYTLADLVLYHVKQHKAFRFLPPSQRKNSFNMPTVVYMELICVKQRSTATLPNTISGHGCKMTYWSVQCTMCATRQPGQSAKPLLTPIPVYGAFNRVGINVIQFQHRSYGLCKQDWKLLTWAIRHMWWLCTSFYDQDQWLCQVLHLVVF